MNKICSSDLECRSPISELIRDIHKEILCTMFGDSTINITEVIVPTTFCHRQTHIHTDRHTSTQNPVLQYPQPDGNHKAEDKKSVTNLFFKTDKCAIFPKHIEVPFPV